MKLRELLADDTQNANYNECVYYRDIFARNDSELFLLPICLSMDSKHYLSHIHEKREV